MTRPSSPHWQGHRDRLRQRFQKSRGRDLSDYEVLELFLFYILPRRDTKPVAKALLEKFKTFENMAFAETKRLCEVPGIGPSAALALHVYGEMIIRQAKQKIEKAPLLDSWERVVEYCRLKDGFQTSENVHILFLNNKNQLISDEIVAEGTVDQTSFYIRNIIKRALELQACSLLLVHNHPSGDVTPSQADIEETRKLNQAAQLMGLTLHDHLVVSKEHYTSLRNMGII